MADAKYAAREKARKMGLANRRHGMARSPEYRAWRGAKDRCLNPTSHVWHRYGGRGITICPEWAASFEAFLEDMGRRPGPRYTLERVDNSQGYGPGNCEWRQWEAQNRNRRNTVMVEWRGMTVSLAKLAARAKVDYGNLHRRITTFGWSVEDALRKPSRQRARA